MKKFPKNEVAAGLFYLANIAIWILVLTSCSWNSPIIGIGLFILLIGSGIWHWRLNYTKRGELKALPKWLRIIRYIDIALYCSYLAYGVGLLFWETWVAPLLN